MARVTKSISTTDRNRKGRAQKVNRKLVDPSIIAEHEVAHGLMRWLRGLKATNIWASAAGGLCEGTGKEWYNKDALLVTLAGYAWEAETLATAKQFKTWTWNEPDFETAREIIRNVASTRIWPFTAANYEVELSVDTSMRLWLFKAQKMVRPFAEFIEDVGALLRQKGYISARSFAALLRHRCPDDWRCGPS